MATADNPLVDLELDTLTSPPAKDAARATSPAGKRAHSPSGACTKRRKVSPGGVKADLSATKFDKFKEELESTDFGPVAELEGEAELGEDGGKACNGCSRLRGGPCWITPGEEVVWGLPNGRGMWCRDCFTVWRLRYGGRVRLIAMPAHFKSSVETLTDFEVGLVSFLSLRRDGMERVTAQQLSTRMTLVQWVLEAFGVPLQSFMVVPLCEATTLSSASQLVSMKVDDSFQVGAMLPYAAGAACNYIAMPSNGSFVQVRSRSRLFTDRASDADAVARLVGGTGPQLAMVVQVAEPTTVAAEMTKSAKKAFKTLRSSISGASLMLHNFIGNDWQDLKESVFSGTLQKLLEAKLEAAHEQMESSIAEAEAWHDNLGATKLFIKKFRECERSKKTVRNSKLGSMSEVSDKVWVFLKANITPGLSFNLVRLKCKFCQQADPPLGIASRVRQMVAADLFAVLLAFELSAPGQNKADGWLRSLLLDRICPLIVEMPVDEVDERRVVLAKDVATVIELIKDGPAMDCLAGVVVDLGMIETLCAAGTVGAPTFSLLAAAEAHINDTPRLAVLKQTLKETKSGAEILSPLAQLKILSANDDLGDQKFNLGAESFLDESMLRVVVRAGAAEAGGKSPSPLKYLVMNPDLVMCSPMLLEGMLVDAMANVLEGIRLWGSSRLEAKEDEVMAFFGNVGSAVCAAEFTLCVHMTKACRPAFRSMVSCELGDHVAAMEAASTSLGHALAHGIPEVSTATLVEQLSNMKANFRGSASIAAYVASVVTTSTRNKELREGMRAVLESMHCMCAHGLPVDPVKAVDQWRARRQSSALAMGLEFIERVGALAAIQPFAFQRLCSDLADAKDGPTSRPVHAAAEIVLAAEGGDGVGESAEVTMGEILQLKDTILELPIVKYMKELVSGCASALMATVGEMASLDSICPLVPQVETESMSKLVSSFLVPSRLAVAVAALTKAVQGGDAVLDISGAFEVFQDVVDAAKPPTILLGESLMDRPCDVKCELASGIGEVYVHLHHVAAGLAWINNTCGAGGCTSNNEFKKDVEVVLKMIQTNMNDGIEVLAKYDGLWYELEAAPSKLKVTIPVVTEWFKKLQQNYQRLCDLVLKSLVEALAKLTHLVKAHTPGYDHYLNEKMCTTRLVKSKLINFTGKALLTSETVMLFKLLADFGRFRTTFGLEPAEDAEDEHAPLLTEAANAFKASKKVIAISAAACVIYSMSGQVQKAELKKLIEKPGDVPPALLAEAALALAGGDTVQTKAETKDQA